MPTDRLSGRRRRAGEVAGQPKREVRLPDGSLVTVRLRMLDARGDRVEVVAKDATGRIAGRATSARVYGPRAELRLALDDGYWRSGLGEILTETLCHVAAQQGISRLLVRLPVSDERIRTMLVARFGARELGSAPSSDLELSTTVEPA